jgi:putative tricarboxylic transport membrane protein
LSALVLLAVGLSALYASLTLGLGALREPGPGFLGFLTSSFISLMATIILVQSFGKAGEEKRKITELWRGLRWSRPLLICGITIGYVLIFEWLGFALSTITFLVALLKGMEGLPWGKVLLISFVCTGFFYLLLSFSLESSLPRGVFGI